jgi:hypothetical protein
MSKAWETKTEQLIKLLGWQDATQYLQEKYHITCKEYDDFILLNYNQIFSPEDNDFVMECRSLQLTKVGAVMSRAYHRFFNYGQRPEITGKFNFTKKFKVFEKADGSLIKIYWNKYGKRWEISTRGTAFGEAEQSHYSSFREAVLSDGLGITEDEFQTRMSANFSVLYTYVFEYCSLKNNIVTPYETPQMVYITRVMNFNGQESDIDEKLHNALQTLSDRIRVIREYECGTIDEVLDAVEKLENLEEGFVLQDCNGLRVKIKNSLYLKLHKMRGDLGFTPKKIASIVGEGEEDEVLTYFPQYKHLFEPIIENRTKTFERVKMMYERVKDIETQKDYALVVKDLAESQILFNMRKGKTFEEVWSNLRDELRVEFLLEANDVN